VRGTAEPWNTTIGSYATNDLKRFEAEWDKFLRGKLPVKNDNEVTDEDIATRNLILFGDPASNTLIAHVLDGLPIKWTKDSITLAGKQYDAATHVPVMVVPSPLNVSR